MHPVFTSYTKCIFFLLSVLLGFQNAVGKEFQAVTIVISDQATAVESKVAALLKSRIQEGSKVSIHVFEKYTSSQGKAANLTIYLGIAHPNSVLASLMQEHRISPLTALNPGQEGFLLQYLQNNQQNELLAAAMDDRGALYAVGEILRQITLKEKHIELPEALEIRTAPAFEIRGTQYGQSGVAKKIAKVRPWTEEETQRVILDYALAGANIFDTEPGPMFDFIKSYGLMTLGEFNPNAAPEITNPEWAASESIGRNGYVCLSVQAARKYMIEKAEKYFRDSPTYDLIQFKGGDGGGCECDLCKPYGIKFITLSEDLAKVVHKYHPKSRIYFTNQKFTNEDDQSIFAYLQEKPRDWLWAWGYGPGSDATSWQPGHRQNHRMDLFKYPGFGPYGLYPLEIIKQIPARHKLLYFNEITHWKYAQHAYIQMYPRADKNGDLPPHWSHDIYERRPDQALTMVYNRLTFYAWPRYYHRVFNDLMRYGVGDVTHSSGHHDHFNQWMWQRLLWSPRQSVEEVVHQYCVTWFGIEAATDMEAAIFQLEANLEEQKGNPIITKEGIENYYALVKRAGTKLSENLSQNLWLWQMYLQKGILDLYTKRNVQAQAAIQSRIENHLKQKGTSKIKNPDIEQMLSWIQENQESSEMQLLKEEAKIVGEKSNVAFGQRNDGYFNLQHDFVGLGWLARQLERAQLANPTVRKELLEMITDYENAGEGGFYDNLGTANHAPHVVFGYPYDHGQPYVSEMLSEGNRPSQRSMHFTQEEEQGVTLRYSDLDKTAKYKVRVTLVRPWYQERYADRMNQKSESIFVNDILLAENVPLPLQMNDFATFNIPVEATRTGELVIRFKKAEDVANGDRISREQWRNSGGWGTMVSEVWLMKQ